MSQDEFEKEAGCQTFDVDCWEKTGLFAHEMISFRCRQMSYMKLSCIDVFRSHLLYVVLKNKKQKYPDDDIELVHL